ncbi:MAG: tyrosine-type recombinase/integrase [Deltaproteobacteria bacterium]
MQDKYRLYRRSNRAQGTFYAQNCETGARESLGTKNRAEAQKLLQAKNDAHSQPALSRELAKAYLHAQDPQFGERTWADVAKLIDGAYEGSTKERFQKFLRSAPVKPLMNLKLVETSSSHFLKVFAHPKAGVSANVQLRILHNRALDLEWILRRVLSRKAWPKIRYGHRHGITLEQHQAVLKVTPNEEYRIFFELLWHTGGSQSDVANLRAENIDWNTRRLFYSRQKLKSSGQGNACLVIGEALELVLKQLPSEGPLFPHLRTLKESKRSNYFWTKRVKAGLPDGVVLHSYRYGWAERAQKAGMPEREAMAHLGHGSKAVHRAYARAADRVTMPLEWYEDQIAKKLIDLQTETLRRTRQAA